jgi:hypothetical protein
MRWLAPLFVALFTVCWGSSTRAAEQLCAPSVLEWTAEWAKEAGVTVEELLCPSDARMVVLRIGVPGSSIFTIELTEHPGRSYKRISDKLGASPIANISDYDELPAGHRNTFESLCSWAADHPRRITLDVAPPAPPAEFVGETDPFPPPVLESPRYERLRWLGPWLFLAGLFVLLASMWYARAYLEGPRWHAPVLLATALVFRTLLATWGPLHTNFQGASWVEAAYNPVQSEWYGPGFPEMFHWLVRLFDGAPDYALFAAVGLLSALTAPLAMAVLRISGCQQSASFWAGMLLAVEPISSRIATTENYLPLLVSLNLAVLLAALLALRARLAGDRFSATVALLATGLLAAHTVRVHPVGWVPLLLTIPLAASLVARGPRQWFASAAWIAAVIGAFSLISYGDQALFNAARIQFSTGHRFDLRSYFPPWAGFSMGGVVILAAGLPWLPGMRDRTSRLVVVAITLLLLLATRFQYAQAVNWQAAYDRLFLVPAALGLFAIWPDKPVTRFFAPSLAVALAILAIVHVGGDFFRPDLQVQQYRFTRAVFAETSPDCGIAFPGGWENGTHGIPHYIATGPVERIPRGHPVASVAELKRLRERAECLYLLRPVIADRDDHRDLWIPFADLQNLRLVAGQRFPAEEQRAYGKYRSSEVTSEIYEVEPF